MKKYLVFLVLLIVMVFPVSVSAAGYCGAWGISGTNPWTVTSDAGGTPSAAHTDVQACISNATVTAGSTLNITYAGGVTWPGYATYIPAAKPLSLIGPGASVLTITATGNWVIETGAHTGAGGAAGTRVSGFKFLSALDQKRQMIMFRGKNNRVDHCVYESIISTSTTGTPNFVGFWGGTGVSASGVADNNIVINGGITQGGLGDYATQRNVWAADIVLGDENQVFVEDNYFYSSTGTSVKQVLDATNASRSTYRYNTIYNGWINVHSIQDSQSRGVRSSEIYGNKSHISTTNEGYGPLAGSGLIYGNDFVSATYNSSISFGNNRSEWGDADDFGSAHRCNGASFWDGNTAINNGTGTHTGTTSSTVLTDSTKSWTTNALIGMTITNETKGGLTGTLAGAACIITANTSTSATCSAGFFDSSTLENTNEYKISAGYPCRDQIGMGTDVSTWTSFPTATTKAPSQVSAPVYVWQNFNDASSLITAGVFSSTLGGVILGGRDFQNHNNTNCAAGGAACTAGVGCGTLANRPSSCTTGVGYWATNQTNCADITGYAGASICDYVTNPSCTPDRSASTTYAGTLYKCTSTDTWEEYFTPYDYPHPLRGEVAPPDSTAPQVSSVSVNPAGTSLTITCDEPVNFGAGGNGGFVLDPSGADVTLTYASGAGTASLVYTISRPILQSENLTLAYTQPTAGVEDVSALTNDLASFTGRSVGNGSTYTGEATIRTLTLTTGTGVSGMSNYPTGTTFADGTAVTVSAACHNGWRNAVYSGDCNATTGNVAMSANRSCSATCSQTPVLNWVQ
jgi:hypothetical protein